jgi:hypothetical protein
MSTRVAVLILVLVTGLVRSLSGQGSPAPATGADTLQLTIVILQTAVSLGIKTAYSASLPRLICVSLKGTGESDPSPAALAALQKPDSLVLRPISACRNSAKDTLRTDVPLLIDTVSGQRGISVSASQPLFGSDGTFRTEIGYYEHGLSSAGWTCIGRREPAGWRVTSCKMNWIS